jgi:imidazoleglycerol-phosphate dehydratase
VESERAARVHRVTRETEVEVTVRLDGGGACAAETGVPFLDHMLAAFARTALCDLRVSCRGDLQVEPHHSVEDVGIVLGRAVAQALGDGAGLCRYGSALLPMDDALARVALDLSGRAHLHWGVDLPPRVLGTFATDLAEEFWRAATRTAAWTLHIDLLRARNAHHGLEAVWKAVGLALRGAAAPDPRIRGPLSTKGVLGATGAGTA